MKQGGQGGWKPGHAPNLTTARDSDTVANVSEAAQPTISPLTTHDEGVLLSLGWSPPNSPRAHDWRARIDEATVLVRSEASQAFFAQLAREIRSVHFGADQKVFVQALLHRAQEAQLFDPNQVDE